MKRTISFTLCAVFCLAIAAPAFAQRKSENDDWQTIQDDRDARRKAEDIEKFIKDWPSSAHRPDVDKVLVDYYVSNKDNQKIMQHAESVRLNLPSADNASKAYIYTQAMLAAYTLTNVAKTVEYGNYALTADPNSFTVASFFARANLPDPAKSLEYANKALGMPKPSTMREEQYQTTLGALHGIVGGTLFGQQKFKEANEHFMMAVKANPKDHASHFRIGFGAINLATTAAQAAQAANDELIKAVTAEPKDPARVKAAQDKQDTASDDSLKYRDEAIDALARALAVGGQFAPQAKQYLDILLQNKNKSLDGEDQLIADKKKELGLP